jgi:hypothetical protein
MAYLQEDWSRVEVRVATAILPYMVPEATIDPVLADQLPDQSLTRRFLRYVSYLACMPRLIRFGFRCPLPTLSPEAVAAAVREVTLQLDEFRNRHDPERVAPASRQARFRYRLIRPWEASRNGVHTELIDEYFDRASGNSDEEFQYHCGAITPHGGRLSRSYPLFLIDNEVGLTQRQIRERHLYGTIYDFPPGMGYVQEWHQVRFNFSTHQIIVPPRERRNVTVYAHRTFPEARWLDLELSRDVPFISGVHDRFTVYRTYSDWTNAVEEFPVVFIPWSNSPQLSLGQVEHPCPLRIEFYGRASIEGMPPFISIRNLTNVHFRVQAHSLQVSLFTPNNELPDPLLSQPTAPLTAKEVQDIEEVRHWMCGI